MLCACVHGAIAAIQVSEQPAVGEQLAYQLARNGAKVICAARSLDKLKTVAEKCISLGGVGSAPAKLDMLDTDSHAAFVEKVEAQHGPIDILVANAGRSQRALVEQTSLDVDIAMLNLNVVGVISITKAVLPAMLKRQRGAIMATSSVAGKVGSTISASYSASKHAIQGFFNALRTEVGYRGITVHLACPGPVATPIQANAFSSSTEAAVDTSKPDTTKRMEAQRCAELMAVQLFHGQYETWLAPQPFLLFLYVAQIFPTLFMALQTQWYGPKRVKAFQGGSMGYEVVQSPLEVAKGILGALFGGQAATPAAPKPKQQ